MRIALQVPVGFTSIWSCQSASHRASPRGLHGCMGIWVMKKVRRRAPLPGIDPLVRPVLSCGRIEEAPFMRLTSFSDYALRLPIHAVSHPVRAANVPRRVPLLAVDDPRLIHLYDWPTP